MATATPIYDPSLSGGGGGGGVSVGAGNAGRILFVDATGLIVSADDALVYDSALKLWKVQGARSGAGVSLLVENTAAAAANTFASVEVKVPAGSLVGNDPRYLLTLGAQQYFVGIDSNQGGLFKINPGAVGGGTGFWVSTIGFCAIGDTQPTTVTGQLLQLNTSSASLNGASKNSSTTGTSGWYAEAATGVAVRMIATGSATGGNIYGLTAAKLGYVDFSERGAAVTIGNFSYYIVTQGTPRVDFQGGGGMKMLTGYIAATREISNADATITIADEAVAQTGTLTANRTFTLPNAATVPNGFRLMCSVNAVAGTGFKVILSGDININGAATYDLDVDWEAVTLVKHTGEWRAF